VNDAGGGSFLKRLGAIRNDCLQTLVGHFADDIVRKWIDYFVLHRKVQSEVITRRIK
jgi:hypothetical protein